MTKPVYIETFDHGPGGWIGWDFTGPARVEIHDGVAISHSPWWVDSNHAPPGAGYLNILFALFLRQFPNFPQSILDTGGPNAYVQGDYPTDLTNAKLTVRIKGDVQLRGAQLLLVLQTNVSKDPDKRFMVNQVLKAQPIQITKDWSEQTITLVPDQKQWVQLGSRFDRTGFYGEGPITDMLRNANYDIIFALFPLDIKPLVPVVGNLHETRWDGREGQLDRTRLPEGTVMLDEIKIEFP